MAVKFYAVKEGKVPGIYKTWDACKKQVMGYSGAVYKSFPTMEQAEAYIGKAPSTNHKDSRGESSQENAETTATQDENSLIAYVDGSYNQVTKAFSYGVVILKEGEEIQFNEAFEDSDLASMRNVAGEIKGSEAAMRYAIEHGESAITIYHDYEGIARWPLGEWKTNKEGTKAYKAYYESIKDQLKVTFVKVKGHSNDKYNDMADQLAKAAIFE